MFHTLFQRILRFLRHQSDFPPVWIPVAMISSAPLQQYPLVLTPSGSTPARPGVRQAWVPVPPSPPLASDVISQQAALPSQKN